MNEPVKGRCVYTFLGVGGSVRSQNSPKMGSENPFFSFFYFNYSGENVCLSGQGGRRPPLPKDFG